MGNKSSTQNPLVEQWLKNPYPISAVEEAISIAPYFGDEQNPWLDTVSFDNGYFIRSIYANIDVNQPPPFDAEWPDGLGPWDRTYPNSQFEPDYSPAEMTGLISTQCESSESCPSE